MPFRCCEPSDLSIEGNPWLSVGLRPVLPLLPSERAASPVIDMPANLAVVERDQPSSSFADGGGSILNPAGGLLARSPPTVANRGEVGDHTVPPALVEKLVGTELEMMPPELFGILLLKISSMPKEVDGAGAG